LAAFHAVNFRVVIVSEKSSDAACAPKIGSIRRDQSQNARVRGVRAFGEVQAALIRVQAVAASALLTAVP